jgi:hypothetical protein
MESMQSGTTAQIGDRPRRPGWRLGVTAVVVLVALAGAVTGVVWWGAPRVGDGSVVGPGDGMTWANDGVEDTRMLVRGRPVATVTATFSIRNEGHLPFTVHGLESVESGDWISDQHVTFGPAVFDTESDATPVRQVTLRPGDEATVFWSLDMPCQLILAEGSFRNIDAFRFQVSWWGISATRELALQRPITVLADDKSSTTAPNGGCVSD